MTKRDKIKNIIVRALDTALNYELADAYRDIVGCGGCPYWHDCKNKHDCDEYILEKLEEESEDNE